ncbi:hypothetical protein EV643_1274 [Kribbella sp. VKM Ac-2527]|uniref:Uncharacterized protein n=1 Tax=Kribbella caucasensis TaxID=2512215 RepID=A0A4R6JEH7_9ACTN|nr:hypothetical protein [Kribbella sp. VKM Ac-2527]TDO34310.1 hypothetical protein EV643_1274 [Kribbella sp. VKM Ac-2527]
MTSRVNGSAVLAVVAIASVLTGVNGLTDRQQATSADQSMLQPAKRAEIPLAPGWRWEGSRTFTCRCWVRGIGASGRSGQVHRVHVGAQADSARPGGATFAMLVECPTPAPVVRHLAPSLEFTGERPEVIRYPDGWTKETRRIGSLLITVTSGDDALREKIFASADVIPEIDGNGCDPVPALARDEVVRPPSQGGLVSVGPVHSVSVCRYSTWTSPTPTRHLTARLLSDPVSGCSVCSTETGVEGDASMAFDRIRRPGVCGRRGRHDRGECSGQR